MFAHLDLLLLLLPLVSSQECSTLSEPVMNGCEYPSLTVTSVPSGFIVNEKNCNTEYEKSEWQEQPEVEFKNAVQNQTYTIVVADPDANGDGQHYYLHWLTTNIPGSDLSTGDLSSANELYEYHGPAPPQGTGTHRYIVLAFKEENKNQIVTPPTGRQNFDIVAWIDSQENKLCGPEGGQQFLAQY